MRVYLTGIGMVSSLGKNATETYQNIKLNKNASSFMSDWESVKPLRTRVAAPVSEWSNSFIPRSARRTMSKMSEMICQAFLESKEMAKLNLENLDNARILMIVGSTAGSQSFAEEFFNNLRANEESYTYCTSFIKTMGHTVATNLSLFAQYNGPSISISAACATSSQAVVLGWELIQSGLYDIVICGGADEIDVYTAMVFDNVGAASRKYNDRPSLASRPFDKDRDGIVISEGASVLILESEDSVLKRSSRPIVEIAGGYYSRDGAMPTQNTVRSIKETLNGALVRAKINHRDINYINAHATGTIQGDRDEALAIKELFSDIPYVSSLKGHLGHSLGACAGIELGLTALMMRSGELLATRNLESIDEDCRGVNLFVEHIKETSEISMSNNFGFGGVNSSIIIRKM